MGSGGGGGAGFGIRVCRMRGYGGDEAYPCRCRMRLPSRRPWPYAGAVRIELTCGVFLRVYVHMSRVLVSDADSQDPKACKALVDGGHVYLDVRTDDEVSQGAPVDCVNVPAFARTDDGMMPMSSTFLKLVYNCDPHLRLSLTSVAYSLRILTCRKTERHRDSERERHVISVSLFAYSLRILTCCTL